MGMYLGVLISFPSNLYQVVLDYIVQVTLTLAIIKHIVGFEGI